MQRADILLVEKALASTRTQAQRLLKEGRVSILENGQLQLLTKAGTKLNFDTEFIIQADPSDRYVSRGALKLEGALQQFSIDIKAAVAIDVGQSTGGFTDCLIQAGAASVVGIEVGHDQLADSLRALDNVTCYEGVNARELPASLLKHTPNEQGFDIAVMDVSFISQTKILPSLVPLIRSGGTLISLVKPQFEVGKAGIGKGGIVKESRLFAEVESLINSTCQVLGLTIKGYIESPIKGGDGNREFLLWAVKP